MLPIALINAFFIAICVVILRYLQTKERTTMVTIAMGCLGFACLSSASCVFFLYMVGAR